MSGEQSVVGERHRRDHAPPETILGNHGKTQAAPRRRIQVARLAPVDSNARGLRTRKRLLAAEASQQLLLPVAGNSGNTDDFTAVNPKADVLEIGAERIV